MVTSKKNPSRADVPPADVCTCTHTRRITYDGVCYTCGRPLAIAVAKKG